MKPRTAERTGEEAAGELRTFYQKHKNGDRGARLTMKIIMREVGVDTIATVDGWLADGDNHHEPKGASLKGLNRFLDNATSITWLRQAMKKGV